MLIKNEVFKMLSSMADSKDSKELFIKTISELYKILSIKPHKSDPLFQYISMYSTLLKFEKIENSLNEHQYLDENSYEALSDKDIIAIYKRLERLPRVF